MFREFDEFDEFNFCEFDEFDEDRSESEPAKGRVSLRVSLTTRHGRRSEFAKADACLGFVISGTALTPTQLVVRHTSRVAHHEDRRCRLHRRRRATHRRRRASVLGNRHLHRASHMTMHHARL